MKEIVRICTALAGIFLAGCVVTDILKEWHLLAGDISRGWIIIPLIVVFVLKELTASVYIRDNQLLPGRAIGKIEKLVEILLILIIVVMVVSLPFVWMGAIKATVKGAASGQL
jgi:hypothetical protein